MFFNKLKPYSRLIFDIFIKYIIPLSIKHNGSGITLSILAVGNLFYGSMFQILIIWVLRQYYKFMIIGLILKYL